MRSSLSSFGVAWLLALGTFSFASCHHQAPAPKTAAVVAPAVAAPPPVQPLVLVPADAARGALVATFVVPAFDRSLGSAIALARKATPLPLDANTARDMLLGQAGIGPDVAKHLDSAAPIAGAVVSAGAGRPALTAFSFAAKSAAEVAPMLAALGHVIARRGAAIEIETPTGEHAWFLPAGNMLLFADSELALAGAGELARESRRTGGDDVSVTLYPGALAGMLGTDVRTALTRFLTEMEERTAATGGQVGPEAHAQLRELVEYLADVGTADLALQVDVGRGVGLVARLHPKAGSRLEGLGRVVQSMPLDPMLVAQAEAGIAGSSAYGDRTLDALRRQRAKLPATGKEAAKVARYMDALLDGLTGGFSMSGRLAPTLALDVVYPIKDAAAGAKIEGALLAVDKGAAAASLAAMLAGEKIAAKITQVRAEKLGKTRAAHWKLSMTVPGDKAGIVPKLLGPGGLDVFVAVVGGDRLVMASGAGAKARLSAMIAGRSKTVSTSMADAVAARGARSMYYYVDLRQGLSLSMAMAAGHTKEASLDRLIGQLTAPMPIYGGVTGDATSGALSIDLVIPPACLTGIGTVLGAIFGAGIAGGDSPL